MQVVADTSAWEGSGALTRTTTPVALAIVNASGQTLYSARSDISLVAAERVMPALTADLIAVKPLRTTTGMPPTQPDLGSEDLFMYPYDADAVTAEPAEELRDEVRAAALAEGPVPPGQRVAGFVYFDRLPQEVARVDLEVALRARPDGPRVAVVRLPFRVTR